MPGPRYSAEQVLHGMAVHWPEAVVPASRLMIRIFRLAGHIQTNAVQRARRHGLGFSELEVLLALRAGPPPHRRPPGELCQAIVISSGGLSKVLAGLETRGLITRPAPRSDRRSRPVGLTPAGKALAETAMADILASDHQILRQGLDEAEMEQMIALLRKLLTAIE